MQEPASTAAFFDLDKTLIARSSGELYVKVLRDQGLLSRLDLVNIFLASMLYRLNLLQPEDLMDKYTRRCEGDSEEELASFCREWFQTTVKNFLYVEAVEKVKAHQKKGHTVVLLTAATVYISEPVGRFLGIDHLLCTRLEVNGGHFTGRLIKPVCHGRGKLFWAERFCREKNIELEKSYFYTDSVRDLPVLEVVGHPVPVNPDIFLLRESRKRGWNVQRFRRTLNSL